MVYTVTFNPAIDYVIQMDELKTGSVNRSKSERMYCGGKGINVSLVLAELGIKSKALGFVAGFTGKAIEDGADFNKLIRIEAKERIARAKTVPRECYLDEYDKIGMDMIDQISKITEGGEQD